MNPPFQALFLHGWATNHHIFYELIKRLPYRVWAADLPGHGIDWQNQHFNIADFIIQLDQQIQQATHIMGWSLGGMIALAYASKHPDKVRSLTLCATMAKYLAIDGYSSGMKQDYLSQLLGHFEQQYNQTLEKFLLLQSMTNPPCLNIAQALIAKQYNKPASLASALKEILQFDARDLLANINLPCLLIYGQKDRITPYGMGLYLQHNLPQAQLKLFAQSAHLPFVSEMPRFIDELHSFWNKV